MGRKKSDKANIEKLQALRLALGEVVDYDRVIAYVMLQCGCTWREIGEVLNTTRQGATYITESIKEVLG